MITICSNCKHMYQDWCGEKRCGAPSEVLGTDHVNGGKRYTLASCLMKNKGDCAEYEPDFWRKLFNYYYMDT